MTGNLTDDPREFANRVFFAGADIDQPVIDGIRQVNCSADEIIEVDKFAALTTVSPQDGWRPSSPRAGSS